MREIYTSPRHKNIDLVVALFAEHGIETRVANRAIYDRPSYRRFSYGPGENRASWARVEIKYAKDMARARELLREAGVTPMKSHFAEQLNVEQPQKHRRSSQSIARRIRTALLVIVAVAVVVYFLRTTGIV